MDVLVRERISRLVFNRKRLHLSFSFLIEVADYIFDLCLSLDLVGDFLVRRLPVDDEDRAEYPGLRLNSLFFIVAIYFFD